MTEQTTDRPITFPRIAPGAWRNAETGIQIHSVDRVDGRYYVVTQRTRYGNPIRLASDGVSLKVARQVALNAALRHRDVVATAYDTATRENVERMGATIDEGEGMTPDFLIDAERHGLNAYAAWHRGDLSAANEWVRVTEQAIAEHRAARV